VSLYVQGCVCLCVRVHVPVHVCLPQREVLTLQKNVQGSSFDTEYAIKYVLLDVFFFTGHWWWDGN